MSYSISEVCVGCGACAKSCPVFAAAGEKSKRHTINEKRCIDCGVCGRNCPMSAIIDNTGKKCSLVKRTEWPKPVINTELCSACGICVNDCTPAALRISLPLFKGDIHVHAELFESRRCVGCGICQRHCPLELITMVKPESQPEEAQ
jgi:formate hydrogenlyase subunit 6/NADH:ubiquinone oxidoreductase subunit I